MNIAPGRFNGNIAEIDWNNGSENLLKRYDYTYDKLNRLTNAFYKEPSTGISGNFDEYLTYDLNGNISNLKRTAIPVSGLTGTLVDNLDYQYTGNRLDKVIENQLNSTGYEGGNNVIDYNLNGSMINMKDKGINSISYNYLNLPNSYGITQANPFGTFTSFSLDYLYRADGTKVRKTYYSGGGRGNPTITNNITDYLDGFQYSYSEVTQCLWCRTSVAYEKEAFKDPVLGPTFPGTITPVWVLDFVPTAEGFYSFTENRYIYQYRDHLGNARVSYEKDSNGELKITDTNNYYAFGSNHIGGLKSLLGGYQNYKYNGKELQETGMYDYGARFYMPDIGRWGVVDPRSQYTHEAYSYVWNNPISFWDPTGMEGEDPDPKKIFGPKGGYPIEEVVMTKTKAIKTNTAGLSFVGADDAVIVTVIIVTPVVLVATYFLSKYLTEKILERAHPIIHQSPYNPYEDGNLDPITQPRSMKTEDNADEDKDANGQNVPKEKKVPVSGKTGKEAAKDVPSWAKEQGEAPYVDEDGKTFAERLLNGQYGKGEWNKGKASKGPGSEFNKIKKWGDRGFEVKKK